MLAYRVEGVSAGPEDSRNAGPEFRGSRKLYSGPAFSSGEGPCPTVGTRRNAIHTIVLSELDPASDLKIDHPKASPKPMDGNGWNAVERVPQYCTPSLIRSGASGWRYGRPEKTPRLFITL